MAGKNWRSTSTDFESLHGDTGVASLWWELTKPRWSGLRPSNSIGQYEIQMLSWSISTNLDSLCMQFPQDGYREKRAMQNCQLHFPAWLGIATGKRLASLLSTWTKSIPSNCSKVASPKRFQWNKSSETARAIRDQPVKRCVSHNVFLNRSTNVMRGSSQPPLPCGRNS